MTQKLDQQIIAMPKVSLHEHLDGGLRVDTLLALALQQNVPLPALSVEELREWFKRRVASGSLVSYLESFELTVPAMSTVDACERVAYELAQDAYVDGCVLAEFRLVPSLMAAHGMSLHGVVESVLQGLQKSQIPCGLILCGMRQLDPSETLETAILAAHYRDQGVVGFDLAGPEVGYPATLHRAAINRALTAGLGVTLHAGEADHGGRVLDAARLGAHRVGHGIRAGFDTRYLSDPTLRNLHFEICPSSNVHTGVAPSLSALPIPALIAAGLSISISTDNRLMSDTTLVEEIQAIHNTFDVGVATLSAMQIAGVRASFLPSDVKTQAEAKISAWQQANGLQA